MSEKMHESEPSNGCILPNIQHTTYIPLSVYSEDRVTDKPTAIVSKV
jgi:hypothetical protein